MESSVSTGYEKKKEERIIDKMLGEQYRRDPTASGISYIEYKKIWNESNRLKKMKTRYSMFEPFPNESAIDFKKRDKTIILELPVESHDQYEERMKKTFNK